MATYTHCPQCGGLLEDDGRCSCGYRPKSQAQIKAAPVLCSFIDHGHGCVYRGIISSTTNGGGQWYCREHWEVINKRVPGCVGNAPWPIARRAAVVAEPRYKPGTMKELVEWREGESFKEFRERLRQEREREDDLVPEEAGQA